MIRSHISIVAVFVVAFLLGAFALASYAHAAEMIGRWALDETTQGATVVDSGSGGNDGTPSGTGGGPSPSTTTAPVNFANPRSLLFNGIDQHVQIDSDFTSAVSVTFWFRPLANGPGNGASDNWYSGTGLFDAEIGGVTNDFGVTWTGNRVLFGIGAPDVTIRSSALSLDTWYHVAATWQKSNGAMRLYLNGSLVASGSGSTNDRISTGVRFGNLLSGANAHYNGYIDDIRTYDVALDPAQIESMANGNSISDPSITTTFSPADNATGVSLSSNLVLAFSTTTAATSTGSINLRQTSDDSLVESFAVNSMRLTRSVTAATTTFTIDPTADLSEGVGYYVSIASTTFQYGSGTAWEGTASTTWNFTTGDFTNPTPSSVSATTTSSAAGISWATAEAASTRVVFGFTTAYSSTTAEKDTSPRVTSHYQNLSPLVACTTYHYAVVSRDAAGNSATSSDNTFTTEGCEYSATPTQATSTPMTSSGGETSLQESGKTFTVTVPSGATSTSFVIQVKAIPSDDVLATLGRPTARPTEVGVTVFDVTAIVNGTTVFDSFDAEVTIEYQYTDNEISGLDESSLRLYHYTGGAWVALNDCSVNASTNTVSCTTPSFSVFGLFGSQASSGGSSGGGGGGGGVVWCAPGQTTFCKPRTFAYTQPAATASACPAYTFTRNLKKGMVGEDVRMLQKFLNCQGFTLGTSGPGAPGSETNLFAELTFRAVTRFQETYANEVLAPGGLTKGTGFFAGYSRAKAHAVLGVE